MTRNTRHSSVWLRLALAAAVLSQVALPSQAASGATAPMEVSGPRQIIVRGLEEPLVAFGTSSAAEDRALQEAIERFYSLSSGAGDFAQRTQALTRFLEDRPNSAWRLSLLTNLGIGYYHDGYFSKAFEAWRGAWEAGKNATDPTLKAMADRAVGELARMHARVGHAEELEKLFAEIGDRPISGSASEMITGAREGLWMFHNDPGVSYLCGPMALKNVLQTLRAAPDKIQALYAERSGPQGYSLSQVSALADRLGLPHRVIVRAAGESVPVPSIINWKVNHFAAIVEEREGRYRVQDPTFASNDLWITKEAIDAEGSGYFLVPTQSTPQLAWRDATEREASQVYGMGFTSINEPGATKPNDVDLNKNCGKGMCVANAKLSTVSLNLNDTPVGYTPALGPAVKIRLSYNQREAGQPAVFSFSNISPKWSMNVMSWIQDSPTSPGSSVTRFQGGGGYVAYTSPYIYSNVTGAFSPERQGEAVLVRIPATGALSSYELRMPDGSKQVFAKVDGAASFPRRVFLTSIVDPAGNALTLNYDAQLRLTSIADASGRLTVFEYGNTARPLLVTSITDPFGRVATLSYDGSGRLQTITDVLGLQSAFSYDGAGLVNAMTTPYGTSSFSYGDGSNNSRFLEMTDPLGLKERVEFQHLASGMTYSDPVAPTGYANYNVYLYYRNTFHWDKSVYPTTGRDYLKANITHWLHNPQGQTSPIVESTKAPLERRVWMKYPNQPISYYEGSSDTPINIARVLDDGTSQASAFTYNAAGLPLTAIDPLGRKTVLTYAANNTDVLSIQQQVAGGALATVASFTYNSQHRPLSSTDAAGKTTQYSYNSAGQLASVTDPLGKSTNFTHDGLGRLITITNENGAVQESRTYDTSDRLASVTDSEGYTLTYSYDAMDRLTQVQYPDGTSTDYTYDKLDIASIKDRLNRVTQYSHDANRRLVSITDPLGRTTSFAYFGNGVLKSITDPQGHTTSWDVDIQSRPIAKHYPDGKTETYAYESSTSRMKTTTDALGQTRTLSYYTDDLVKAIAYGNAQNATPGVSFAYDAYFPRRTTMTDGLGTTTWNYHPIGANGALQLASENGPYGANDTVAYSYDELGRLTGRTIDSASETFGYDALSRITSHGSALGAFSFDYLGQTSQIINRVASTGLVGSQWSYEDNSNDRRLKSITHSGQARGFGFTTTPEGMISGMSETVGGSLLKTWSFDYDESSRLLSATPSSDAGANYAYDDADNLTHLSNGNGTRTATYNALNQITSLNGVPYTYDANGNLLDDGIRTYGWDAENRLITVTVKASGKQSTFRYDGLGRRLAIVDGASETRYLWCGTSLCQARNSSDTVVRRYFEEGVIYPQGGTVLYYGHDHLGSVRDVSAVQNGAKLASFDYDPYGDITKVSGRITPEFRYAGLFYHGASGLYLANYRAYDPKVGRWVNRDPIKEDGGLNLYGYVEGNPVNAIDPTGEFGIVGAVIGAGVEIGIQAIKNYASGCDVFDFHNYDWWDVGVSAAVGAIAPGWGSVGKTTLRSRRAIYVLRDQLSRARSVRRIAKLEGRIANNTNAIRDAVLTQVGFQGAKAIGKAALGEGSGKDCNCDK